MSTRDSTPLTALEKTLVGLATGISILAALSFATLVVGMLNGIGRDELATGFWAALGLITWLGFPIALGLLISYIVTIWVKNAKANRLAEQR